MKNGHLVEARREDLVAGYLGQTAIKTKAKIEEALDGVLFIDEAYSLNARNGQQVDPFGAEAVSTLIAEMENNRDRLAVVVAGYPEEMNAFINMNPGLSSRFTRYIEFEDYRPEELAEVFMKLAEPGYKLQEEAGSALREHLALVYATRNHETGNARFVRTMFQETIVRHASRINKSGMRTRDSLSLLTVADLPLPP